MKAARNSWIALLALAATAAAEEKPPEDKAPPAPPKEEDGKPPGGPRGPGQRGGDGRDGREGFRRMVEAWKEADTDKDGFISPTEFAAMKRPGLLDEEKRNELFKRFDKDSDGKISTAEIENVMRKPPGGMPLEEADANKDQRIVLEEFTTLEWVKKMPTEKQQELFKRFDTDGDGALTAKDRPQRGPRDGRDGRDGRGGRRGGGGLLEMVKNHDKDGNGSLNFEEFREIPWVKGMGEDQQEDRFEEFDKNKDLKLDAADAPPPGEHQDRGDKDKDRDKPKEGKKPEGN